MRNTITEFNISELNDTGMSICYHSKYSEWTLLKSHKSKTTDILYNRQTVWIHFGLIFIVWHIGDHKDKNGVKLK
jgi:hypothetical protein